MNTTQQQLAKTSEPRPAIEAADCYNLPLLDKDYLASVLRFRLQSIPSLLVLRDVRIEWDVKPVDIDLDPPGLCVVPDFQRSKKQSTNFNVATQGTRPSLIIEIVTPGSREIDTVDKVEHYLRCGVKCYIIIDRESRNGRPKLIGRELRGNSWSPILPDEKGRLVLLEAGMYLGVVNDRVRCYDPSTRTPLGDYTEVVGELALTKSQIIAERQFRERAEAKAEQAEEARLREAEARLAAESRVAELEARLQAMQSNNPITP